MSKIFYIIIVIFIILMIFYFTIIHNQYKDCFIVTGKFGNNNKFKKDVLKASDIIKREKPKNFKAYYEFPEFILTDKKWESHLKFLKDPEDISKKGGGYWFWKAPIIKHHLKEMKDNEYYIHLDLDKTGNFFLKIAIPYLVYRTKALKADLCLIILPFKELEWTKMEVLDYFGLEKTDNNSKDIDSFQYNANIIIIRKNANTLKFIEEWEKLKSNWKLLNDDPSSNNEHNFFVEHRHDQSLLSLLAKKYTKDRILSYDRYLSYIKLKEFSD